MARRGMLRRRGALGHASEGCGPRCGVPGGDAAAYADETAAGQDGEDVFAYDSDEIADFEGLDPRSRLYAEIYHAKEALRNAVVAFEKVWRKDEDLDPVRHFNF